MIVAKNELSTFWLSDASIIIASYAVYRIPENYAQYLHGRARLGPRLEIIELLTGTLDTA